MEGWIKLHRKMVNWEWYQDNNVKAVFLHLLIFASHDEHRYKGMEIKRGSLITSLGSLSESLGMTVSQIRTALQKLEKTGEITKTNLGYCTLLNIENYELYQGFDSIDEQTKSQSVRKALANKSQSDNKAIATYNNDNNKKNDKNDKTNKKYGGFENVILSDEEYEMLKRDGLVYLIDELSTYIASTGKNYASHYATLLSWSNKREKEKAQSKDKLSRPPSFDIKKLEYEAMFNDDYDI